MDTLEMYANCSLAFLRDSCLVHVAKVAADGVNSIVRALNGLTKGMTIYCMTSAMKHISKYGSLMWECILAGYPNPSSMLSRNSQKG